MNEEKGSMPYPAVKGEDETLDLVLQGRSIARYGDGEFKIAAGGGCVSQVPDRRLSEELREILHSTKDECLVGVPTMDRRSPKYGNWEKYEKIYPRLMRPGKTYYSAFITRPDSAPWIDRPDFFDKVESLWAGKHVTMVYGSARSLTENLEPMRSANVTVIPCDRRDAYAQIDVLEKQILLSKPHVVLLMCGPTATCLAHRLAGKKHAVDLGHIGMFWRTYANEKYQAKLKAKG